MSKTPKNHGKPWTPPENAQLRKLANENTPTRVMGLKLGRTEASVRSHEHEENVSLKPTNRSPHDRQKTLAPSAAAEDGAPNTRDSMQPGVTAPVLTSSARTRG